MRRECVIVLAAPRTVARLIKSLALQGIVIAFDAINTQKTITIAINNSNHYLTAIQRRMRPVPSLHNGQMPRIGIIKVSYTKQLSDNLS